MMDATPLYAPGEAWTDAELEANFRSEIPVKKAHLLGLLAKRSPNNSKFRDILKTEILSPNNREEKFFGFIKWSWIPVLAILEHSDDSTKAHLREWLQQWTAPERSNLREYLHKEPELLRWLGE